jgi:hypothetical protein
MEAVGVQWCYDRTIYPLPEEIVLPLSHRDVWLGYSGTKKEIEQIIDTLRSGDELQLCEESYSGGENLYFAVKREGILQKIACTSKSFYEEICRHRAKGYEPCHAKVLFVVNWMNKDSRQEYRIVLPVVRMRKNPTIH